MSESQHQQGQTRLLLNIALVILETFYSFVLKHDRVVRLQAKKFVEQQVIIKMNSYIPFFEFYVQFTDKGLLFDVKAPDKAPELSINSSVLDLIQIFVFGNRKNLKKLRIEGDAILKDEFKDLSLHLSMPKLLSDWKQWLINNDDDDQSIASSKRIAPLLEKIDLQRSKINSLEVEVKQYKNRIRRMQMIQKRVKLAFIIIAVLFCASIGYNIWAYLQ